MTDEQYIKIKHSFTSKDKEYALLAQPRLLHQEFDVVMLNKRNWKRLNNYFKRTKILFNP